MVHRHRSSFTSRLRIKKAFQIVTCHLSVLALWEIGIISPDLLHKYFSDLNSDLFSASAHASNIASYGNKNANSNSNSPRDGRSGNRAQGVVRGECSINEEQLAEGQPFEERLLRSISPIANIGDTTQVNPTLWFYVPYLIEDVALAKFSLQDENGYNVSVSEFSLKSGLPGIVGVTVPYELDLNNEYRWYFRIYCDEDDPAVRVNGWIRLIESPAELENSLDASNSVRYRAYQDNEIWFDAVDYIISQYLETPKDTSLVDMWNSFLATEAIQLDEAFENLSLENLVRENSINRVVPKNDLLGDN